MAKRNFGGRGMRGRSGGSGRNSGPARAGDERVPRGAHAGREVVAAVKEAVTPVVKDAGLYLENLRMRGGARAVLEVIVDLPGGPGGVGSDALAEVSRAISARLDEANVIDGAYVLEVSTPGIDRPLRDARQFSRAEGHLVDVTLTDGTVLSGRVKAAEGDTVILCIDGSERPVALADVKRGAMQPEFGQKE